MLLANKIYNQGGAGGLTISSVTANVKNIVSGGGTHFEIWSDSGGSGSSPVSQIGQDSEVKTPSGTGDITFNFAPGIAVPAAGSKFWVIIQAAGGDINYNRGSLGSATGVTGGDFEASATITNLVSASTVIPRFTVTFSDGTTAGLASGTTGIGMGASLSMGLLITNA